MHHVIIGSGPAGIVAAEHLRKRDKECRISVVSAEPEPPYSRMAIPYLLNGKIEESGTYLRKGDDYYGQQEIELVSGRVDSVDGAGRRLTLSGGGGLGYDKLLIAAGSRPVKPPVEGMDLEQVQTCWTLADARRIMALAQPGSKVVLMGAGFIGCIILEALAARGVNLTVVEMAERMVARMMNTSSGDMLKSWCESKGVRVLTGVSVSAIGESQGQKALVVMLGSGQYLLADLVISAAGVKPNIEFLDGSGVETEHGILVDEQMQTSVTDIYAAGDVAQGRDFSTGEYTIQAIQPTAVEHGRIAASNMAQPGSVVHGGSVNMNVLDTMGLISASFGQWQGVDGGEQAELSDKENYKYLNLQFADDVLVGANSLGLTDHVGVLRGLIQSRRPLGKWKKRLRQNPLHLMEAYLGAVQSSA